MSDDYPTFMRTPWNQLQARLKPETVVWHWSRKKKLIGRAFTVVAVSPTHLDLRTSSKTERPVCKGEFEKVAAMWPDYLAGLVRRGSISSANTTYIFSLLHWLQVSEVAHV